MVKLSARLQAIADLVPKGGSVADIGTDHGYIPVRLAQNGLAKKITAADINAGPLNHARLTAAEHGVSNYISFELCSGLEFPTAHDHDTIIIAGMGGELIISILEKASWTKDGVTLILQPNSRIHTLVGWLQENGYFVESARLVKDAGKLYQILVVRGGEEALADTEAKRLVHSMFFQLRDPLLGEYLDTLIARYTAAEQGMLSGKREAPELLRTQAVLQDLKKMKQEVMEW